MTESEIDPRDRLLQAALELLNEEADLEKITVRRIAERAGVGIGLINYHYQTKENLLNLAIGKVMEREAGRWLQPTGEENSESLDPLTRLRMLLKGTSRIGARYPHMLRFMLRYEMEHGNLGPCQMILPLLREIFGARKDDLALRLIAMQMVTPLQVAGLRTDAFRAFTGLDITNDRQRDQAVDLLIEQLI